MTQQPNPPAGWYPRPDGSQHYWDGVAWTGHSTPPAAAGPPSSGPAVAWPAQSAPQQSTSGKAIAAFVLSLVWLAGVGSIVGVLLGVSALKETRHGARSGRGLAVGGIILGIFGIVATVWSIFYLVRLGNDLNDEFGRVQDCLKSPTAAGCR